MEGGELGKFWEKNKPFSEEMVVFYAYQLISGVGYLHKQNIIHRDLKVQNILIDRNGYLKICDYGLGKILADGEKLQGYAGTVTTMAPEVMSKEKYDSTSDWYSVGMIIF